MDVTHELVTVALIVLALTAAVLWGRHRTSATAWVFWTFSVLAVARLLGDLPQPDPATLAGTAARRASPVAVMAFPYLLFRFSASLEPVQRRASLAVGAVTGAALAVTALAPHPPEGAAHPLWYDWYVAAALAYWTALSGWVVWRLWRAGQRQAAVARRRMRMLASGTAALNAALLLAGVNVGPDLTTAAEAGALASVTLFLLGFTPPSFVRALWRRPDEQALWAVERDLVAATTREEVAAYLLPRVNRLLGGAGAVFVDVNGNETSDGVDPSDRDALRDQLASVGPDEPSPTIRGDLVALTLREGRLGVVSSPYTPLFGRDELDAMERLGTLTDLALSRAELFEREREARNRAEALRSDLEKLVYGLSHDLRSPIVSVLGYVECLAEDYGHVLDEEGQRFLSGLKRNTTYMDELISDLLELSRAGQVAADAGPVDLAALCGDLVKELEADYPLATFDVAALPTVALNPARARQLMTNLLNNAVMHAGRADVTVRVRTCESADHDHVCVAVVDDGQGIPPSQRERVFRLFERLDDGSPARRPSSGVGLAISRKIVEQAKGRIWVADSAVGADVRVELPLGTVEGTGNPERPGPTEAATGEGSAT